MEPIQSPLLLLVFLPISSLLSIEGTMCRNNAIVPKDSCNSEQCVKDAVFCVDKSNTIVVDTCTDHFIQCQDGGAYSEPMPVAGRTSLALFIL